MLFASGGSDGRRKMLESSPVKVKLTLHRVEGGVEVQIKLFQLVRVSKAFEPARREPQRLPDDVAVSVREYTEYSDKPEGTPDASTYVLSFSSGAKEPRSLACTVFAWKPWTTFRNWPASPPFLPTNTPPSAEA